MQTRLKPWGNSQGIRFSKEMLETAGFGLNDALEVFAMKDQIVIRRQFVHRTLEERAAAYGGKLNLSGETDWGEPKGDEAW